MGRPKKLAPGEPSARGGKVRVWWAGKWRHLGLESDPAGWRAALAALHARAAVDPAGGGADAAELLVPELFDHYLASADSPRASDHRTRIKTVLKLLAELHPTTPAAEFTPADFRAWQAWVCKLPDPKGIKATRFNATSVRDMRAVVKSVWKWGVGNRDIPAGVWQALRAVPPPKHTEVRAAAKVKPADPGAVERVLPLLPPVVAAVVRLIRLTGARPTEVMTLKPCQVGRAGDVWVFRPETHKGTWRGKTRTLYLGADAQAVLAPWLDASPEAFAFRPTGPRAKAERYNHRSLGLAVRRACKRAGVRFSAYQLRHLLGTEVRAKHGLEATRAVLGQSYKSMADHYSGEADRELAERVARGA